MWSLVKTILSGLRRHLKSVIWFVAIVVGGVVIINLAFSKIATNSKACLLCHYMKPYFDQWKTSTHAQVACVSCHPLRPSLIGISTLKYLTNNYNPRPRAEVADESCLNEGCHNRRLENGKVYFKSNILFDHNLHVGKSRRGQMLRCTSCHYQIVQGQHISVTEKVCFLCHFKGAARGESVTGCPSCHGTPTKTVEHDGFTFSHGSYLKIGVACNQCHLDVASGKGDVPKERCFSCHIERMESYKDREFMHDNHVAKHGVDCFSCHTEIRHGEIQMIKALEITCESCHKQLHSMQKELYMGASGRGVVDTPSRMFAAQVSCDGCHTKAVHSRSSPVLIKSEESLEAERKSCITCHGVGFDLMLDDWVKAMDTMIKEFRPQLEKAEAMVDEMDRLGQIPAETKGLLEDARYNFNFVVSGRGAHNVEYAVKLVKAASEQLDMAMKYLDRNYKAPKRSPLLTAADGYCRVLCHDRIKLPDELDFEGMSMKFPHSIHVDDVGVSCDTCHSPEKHKQQIISREGCMDCHHKQRDVACERCHTAQSSVYRGEAPQLEVNLKMPSPKLDAVSCTDCHNLKSTDHGIVGLKDKCVECHKDSYGTLLIDWERQLLGSLNNLILKIEEARGNLETAKKRKIGVDLTKAESLLREAKSGYELIDKGKGVHNKEFADKVISISSTKLSELDEILKK